MLNRTWLEDFDKEQHFDDETTRHRFSKLPIDNWNKIHIRYETAIHEQVYKHWNMHHTEKGNRQYLLNNRLYLRILYEVLISDRDLGGAQFEWQKYFREKDNPFVGMFALHLPYVDPAQPNIESLMNSAGRIQRPVWPNDWYHIKHERRKRKTIEQIRDYYVCTKVYCIL